LPFGRAVRATMVRAILAAGHLVSRAPIGEFGRVRQSSLILRAVTCFEEAISLPGNFALMWLGSGPRGSGAGVGGEVAVVADGQEVERMGIC